MTTETSLFNFDNSYARELEGFYVPVEGAKAPHPEMVMMNTRLGQDLGLDVVALDSALGATIFSGSAIPEDAASLAQAYAGHQFGGFSPQLGDGRALLLGEVLDPAGRRFDIHLKGSGRTPFSRGGDGKAVLGPVLREYLMGEAMHALGIPTTRALAAVKTGENVMRDGPKPGAVLARVATSHLRVGTFQFFAARKEWDKVRQLADYTIARHYPDLVSAEDKYLKFLAAVADRQAALVAKWLHVGFVHGVMNTDNMAISGETIDYGPCAFIDHYDAQAVFSSIDREGRYAYGSQPVMARWNVARLAETLLPLIDPDDHENASHRATHIINDFPQIYMRHWAEGMGAKIGLTSSEETDVALFNKLFAALDGQSVDHTVLFRRLADTLDGDNAGVLALFEDESKITEWLADWHARLVLDGPDMGESVPRAARMNAVNPIYIPRNYHVEGALRAAENGNMMPFKVLLDVLSAPFTKREGLEGFEGPPPDDFGPYKTFCGT